MFWRLLPSRRHRVLLQQLLAEDLPGLVSAAHRPDQDNVSGCWARCLRRAHKTATVTAGAVQLGMAAHQLLTHAYALSSNDGVSPLDVLTDTHQAADSIEKLTQFAV